MRTRPRWLPALVAVVGFVGGVLVGLPRVAHSQAPRWAPEASATIHPGVMLFTAGSQCTANFVFTQGSNVYLGTAAHCAAADSSMQTNGCQARSLPVGTPVTIAGATRPGTLAYSSWATMQSVGERSGRVCFYNDFALVRIDPVDHGRVNPTVPHWGGPQGLKGGDAPPMSQVYGYGNSGLRGGLGLLSPMSGVSLGTTGGGWTHPAYTVTPGVPGDSGGAMLDASGMAGGVLSTLTLWPLALSNNYADLRLALEYARNHGGPNVSLAHGTRPFNGAQAPLQLG